MNALDTVVATGMKITCRSEELAEKLAVVGRGVSTANERPRPHRDPGHGVGRPARRSPRPTWRSRCGSRSTAKVEDEGSVVVPGRLLVDIARLLPPGEVTVEHRAEEGVARLTCGPASYALHTFSAEDFPRLPELDPGETFAVDRQAFLDTVVEGRAALRRATSRARC